MNQTITFDIKKKTKGIIPTISSKYSLLFRVGNDKWTVMETPLFWLDVKSLINDIKDYLNSFIDETDKTITNIIASSNRTSIKIEIYSKNIIINSYEFFASLLNSLFNRIDFNFGFSSENSSKH